jgi:hypothetical protein
VWQELHMTSARCRRQSTAAAAKLRRESERSPFLEDGRKEIVLRGRREINAGLNFVALLDVVTVRLLPCSCCCTGVASPVTSSIPWLCCVSTKHANMRTDRKLTTRACFRGRSTKETPRGKLPTQSKESSLLRHTKT